MQPASHRDCHTRTDPAHTHRTTSTATNCAPYSCRGVLAWCGVCGVESPASDRGRAGEPSPCSLVVFYWSYAHLWLLRLRCGSVPTPALLPAPAPVWRISTPVRRGTVADARLAPSSICQFFFVSWPLNGVNPGPQFTVPQ